MSPWGRKTKENINIGTMSNYKDFGTVKETINKMKRLPT